MIWIILYVICTAICCGILLYVIDPLDYNETAFTCFCSLFWPAFLVLLILYGLGHCIRLLLEKVIKTK
jgi:hypothetical protein